MPTCSQIPGLPHALEYFLLHVHFCELQYNYVLYWRIMIRGEYIDVLYLSFTMQYEFCIYSCVSALLPFLLYVL